MHTTSPAALQPLQSASHLAHTHTHTHTRPTQEGHLPAAALHAHHLADGAAVHAVGGHGLIVAQPARASEAHVTHA